MQNIESMNQEESRELARTLFNFNFLEYRGQGFYMYTENLENELISRKGLEYCASLTAETEELVIISRNDEQTFPEFKLGLGVRYTILQRKCDYDKDQERITARKANNLMTKYNK